MKFNQRIKQAPRYLLIPTDAISACLSFYLAYVLLPFYRPYLRPENFILSPFGFHLWLLLLIFPIWYILGSRAGLYRQVLLPWRFVLLKTLHVQGIGLLVLSVLFFAFKLQAVSRLIIFSFCILYIPVSALNRLILRAVLNALRYHIYDAANLLVVGTKERAREFIQRVKKSEEQGCMVVGCVDPEEALASGSIEGVPIVGTTAILSQYIFTNPIDAIVFAMPLDRIPDARSLINAGLELGLQIIVIPDFQLQRAGFHESDPEVTIESFSNSPAVVLSNVPHRTSYLVVKRLIDIVVAAVLLILLAPFFAVIALLVRISSPGGPVFYRWNVLGINKKPFVSYKFRTMVPSSDELKQGLREQNEMQGPVFKMRSDPRITPLGRFLRKYSLDELPQLWSVLKGDLSLVGPRPPFREEADRYEFWQRRKLSIKPGITCLWQVNGRNEITSFEEWVRLDLEYIENASVWLDLKILLKTIPVVLRGRGAY